MTYRRDLLNIRVVVRQAQGLDAAVDAPVRRVQTAASLAVSPQPTPHVTQPAMRPVSATDHGASREVILVKTALKQVAVRLIEITVVEAARNYVRIHLEGGTVLKSRVPISLFARHLSPDRFLRIHRGCLVNVDRIKAVSPIVGGRLALTLNNGARVIVARDRRRVVLAELGRTTVAAGSP